MKEGQLGGQRMDAQGTSEGQGLDAASIEALAALVDRIGEEDFDRRLLAWLGTTVPFDSALVLLYADRQRPRILLDALTNPGRLNKAEHYVDGAYLLDPFYRHACSVRVPTLLQLADIVTEDFSRSDYVATYYGRSAIRDEINFLIPIDAGTCAVALERSLRKPAFSGGDLQRLRLLLPLLASLVRRHRSHAAAGQETASPDREHLRLERVLADFGSELLTPREREVAGLMLRGFALAQIAARLDISPETARVHRRNIYEKLRISSLAELFSLALADLAASR